MAEKSWPNIEKSWFEWQKVGLVESIFALQVTKKCPIFPNFSINVLYYCLSTLILSVCMHANQKNCHLQQKLSSFMKKCDFFIFSSKNVNVRSKNGACTLNSSPISKIFADSWSELNYLKSEQGHCTIWRYDNFGPPL